MKAERGAYFTVAVFLGLLVGTQFPGRPCQSAEPASLDRTITRSDVTAALEELCADNRYSYRSSELEDPAWFFLIESFLRKLRESWLWRGGSEDPAGVIFALAASVGVLVLVSGVLFLLARYAGMGRVSGRGSDAGESLEAASGGVWGDAGVSRAVELAQAGNLRQAVSALFASLLRGLESFGWVVCQKGKPSRAYLRQLRKSDELYPLFRDFLFRFELAFYRQPLPSRDDWEFMYQTYGKIAETVVQLSGQSRRVRPRV